MTQLPQVPWPVITFIVGQFFVFIWFVIKIHFANKKNTDDIKSLKTKTDNDLKALKLELTKDFEEIKRENVELKKEIKDMRDILIRVESNTQLLMLGRIKTGQKEAA